MSPKFIAITVGNLSSFDEAFVKFDAYLLQCQTNSVPTDSEFRVLPIRNTQCLKPARSGRKFNAHIITMIIIIIVIIAVIIVYQN